MASNLNFGLALGAEMVNRTNAVEKEIAFDVPSPELEQFVDSPVHADVKLVIQGQSYFAHKKALVASSKYFEAMFDQEYGFKESSEFTVNIELPAELSLNETRTFLKVVYTGCDNEISSLYGSNELKASCFVRLALAAEYLQMENFLQILLGKMIKLGAFHFEKPSSLHSGMLEEILDMILRNTLDRKLSLKPVLLWLHLAKSRFPEEISKWNAIKNVVVGIVKNWRLNGITELFRGLPYEFATWFDSELFVLAVLNYRPPAPNTCKCSKL